MAAQDGGDSLVPLGGGGVMGSDVGVIWSDKTVMRSSGALGDLLGGRCWWLANASCAPGVAVQYNRATNRCYCAILSDLRRNVLPAARLHGGLQEPRLFGSKKDLALCDQTNAVISNPKRDSFWRKAIGTVFPRRLKVMVIGVLNILIAPEQLRYACAT